MPAVIARLRTKTARLLLACFTALFVLTTPITAAAASGTPDPTGSTVDALWNQPQGVRADSFLYVVQSWWDGLSRSTQSDPTQRGLGELQQANSDLLNAYTLVAEQRTDPGPHPVPVIDPLISSVYGFITGNHPKAVLGTAFGWVNSLLLKLEGRGSTQAIIQSLLNDYQQRQAAAARDLKGQAASEAILATNWSRQDSVLQKIESDVDVHDGIGTLVAQVQSSRKSESHNSKDKEHGGGKDSHGNAIGGNSSGKKP
jgi:hypothetical protein